MKEEEKNVLMKVVWSSSVGLRRLHSKKTNCNKGGENSRK